MRVQLLFGLSVCCLFGCGAEPPYEGKQRYPISGTVTFQGEPVDGGMIAFVPQEGALNPAGGPIIDGKFEVSEEKGPNAGNYRVQISWMKPTGKQIHDDDSGEMIDEVKEVIPAKYNGATELTEQVKEASGNDSTANQFEFQLE